MLNRVVQGSRVSSRFVETRAYAAQRMFQSLNPPVFTGDEEAIYAVDWILEIEWQFETLQLVEDDLRMAVAPSYLRGEGELIVAE